MLQQTTVHCFGSGMFHILCRVPGAHTSRLRQTVLPPERPRLLLHVLRYLSAYIVHLHNHPQVYTS